LAPRHDLVLGERADELTDGLGAVGAAVVPVDGVKDLAGPGATGRLVNVALERMGLMSRVTASELGATRMDGVTPEVLEATGRRADERSERWRRPREIPRVQSWR
jgi:hypothetical protein